MPEPVTDRDMIVQLAERVMGWTPVLFYDEDRREDKFPRLVQQIVLESWWLIQATRECGRDWNPLESPADALELEGLVPEEKHLKYIDALWTRAISSSEDYGKKEAPAEWLFRRLTPRQISTAVFSVMCQEGKCR